MKTINFYPILVLALLISVGTIGCKKDKSPEPEPVCTKLLDVESFEVEIDEHPEPNTILATIPFTACAGTVSFYGANGITWVNQNGEITPRKHTYFNYEGSIKYTEADYEVTYTGEDTVFTKTITVRFNLKDVDELGHFLTDSKYKYVNAKHGEWISVTAQEYSNVQFNLNAQVGGLNINTYPSPNVWITTSYSNKNRLIRNKTNTQVGKFLIAFKYLNTYNSNTNVEVRVNSDSDPNKNYRQAGEILPGHAKGHNYFILKGGFENPTNYGNRLAVYTGDSGGVAYVDDQGNEVIYGANRTTTYSTSSYSDIAAAIQCFWVSKEWYTD